MLRQRPTMPDPRSRTTPKPRKRQGRSQEKENGGTQNKIQRLAAQGHQGARWQWCHVQAWRKNQPPPGNKQYQIMVASAAPSDGPSLAPVPTSTNEKRSASPLCSKTSEEDQASYNNNNITVATKKRSASSRGTCTHEGCTTRVNKWGLCKKHLPASKKPTCKPKAKKPKSEATLEEWKMLRSMHPRQHWTVISPSTIPVPLTHWFPPTAMQLWQLQQQRSHKRFWSILLQIASMAAEATRVAPSSPAKQILFNDWKVNQQVIAAS